MDTHSPGGAPGGAPDADALLARADALRDARDWTEAATAYAGFLRLRPEAWGIWVQYGHCLKESGDPKAALLLYREAERLQPDDADLHVQIGHALKLIGRLEEAYQHYARALSLDPDSPAAQAELLEAVPAASPETARGASPETARGASPETARGAGPETEPETAREAATMPPAEPAPATVADAAASLLFDVSDLLDFVRHNRAPTGIQRVQINIVEAALAAHPGAAAVAFDAAGGSWKALPASVLARLIDLARSGADATDPAWTAAVAAAQGAVREGAALPPPPDATLVNLGTSWWIPDYLRRIRAARRATGLRYVAFLHDCIPLVVPEHCEPKLVDEFARWFAGLCFEADLVLCNSACTRADFARLAAALLPGGAVPPTAVVPLDAAWPAPARVAAETPVRPYVLFVGTFESRKDHLLVFRTWLALLRTHGAAATPDLICVGKRGWLAEPALALHAGSAELRARVRLLHDVSDAALSGLYAGALFALYNSAYEGWGLPVTESLAHGKVVLLPDHSSLREAGGAGGVFFAAGSAPELQAALERLIFDPDARRVQEARITGEVRLRSWGALTAQLLREVAAVRPRDPQRPALAVGAIQPLALLPGPVATPAMARADALRDGAGWSRLEPWGAWTLPGESRLRIPVEGEGGPGPWRLHLELAGPLTALRFGLRAGWEAGAGTAFRAAEIGAGEALFCTLDLPAGAGTLLVEFDNGEGSGAEGTARRLGVGVRAVMLCRADDVAARLDWIEARAMPRLLRL